MKKKTVSLLLSLAMCLTMLPGQSVFAAETSTETETEAASESTGNHVENLIVGTIADQNVFNSLTQTDAFGRMNYNGFTQGDFVYRDENNNLQPYFWKSFEISEDGKQIDFTIPLDAVWHDGEPVTMDDVVFTFEYMRDVRKNGSLQNLTEVKVTGDDSASLIFSEPDAYYWINSSCNNNACVYAKHIWEGIDDPTTLDGPEAAIGCGPYKLVSYDSDAQVSYYEAVPENDFLGEITVDKVTVQNAAIFNVDKSFGKEAFKAGIIGAIPFNSTLFGDRGNKLQYYYNIYNRAYGQIPPTIGAGYYYFGFILAPIISILFVKLSLVYYDKAQKINKSIKYISEIFCSITFALGTVMYSPSITLAWFFSWGIPMLILTSFTGEK